MKAAVIVSLLLASVAFGQQAQGQLTNQRIGDMVLAGVSQSEIIRIIASAPTTSFDLRPGSTDTLLKAGVSEDIIEAMEAREAGFGATPPQPNAAVPSASGMAPRVTQMPKIGAGSLESLSHGLYCQSAQQWKKLNLTQSSGFSTKHGAAGLVGVHVGGVRLFDGSEAADRFHNRRPVFAVKVDASRPDVPGFNVRDLLLLRMAKKKHYRELQVIAGGFESIRTGFNPKDRAEVTLTTVADRAFTLTPKNDLAPGEYLITFRGANGLAGYDFGIQ
jgi:hypothetical protein